MSKRRDLYRIVELSAIMGDLAKAVRYNDYLQIKLTLGALMHVAVGWYDEVAKLKGENHEKH